MDCRLSPLVPRFSVSTRNEMATLRSISTRAAITATSFTNHYEWGDLKANPSKLVEKYFDAFVYVANWGTREFHIRLPQGSIDYKLLKAMVPGESLRVRKTGTFVIVEFGFEPGWDGEDDGTRWMASLMPVRSDLLRGDHRCLYLSWLRSAQDEDLMRIDWNRPFLQAWKSYPARYMRWSNFSKSMRTSSRLQHRLQNLWPSDRIAESCPHGFGACLKRTSSGQKNRGEENALRVTDPVENWLCLAVYDWGYLCESGRQGKSLHFWKKPTKKNPPT
jgi:hypothetical protein